MRHFEIGLARWCGRPALAFAVLSAFACSADKQPTAANPATMPAAVAVVAGDVQTGVVNGALSAPVAVRVTSAAGGGLAGASVRFAVTAGEAFVNPASAATDTSGRASTTVTLGGSSGPVTVTATVAGTTLAATFHATAITPDADSTAAPTVYNPDWTEATHGKVSPNYAEVFPQEAVNTIEITLTTAQWSSVRANMIGIWGFDFGSHAPPRAFPTTDPDYVAVAVRYNGKLWKKVGWRPKGNSTLSLAWRNGNFKLPFKLKTNAFESVYPAILGQRFYGFKELSFAPGVSDSSLIREKVAADIFRLGGVPAARTAFYRVFIDFGAGMRYVGVYTGVETIEDSMVKDQFGDDKGNIYKPESNFRIFIEAQFEKKNNKTSSFGDVQAAITALNSPVRTTNAAQWRASLEAVFSVDHFLRWLAINNALVNWDSYGTMEQNYYLFNHPTRKLLWIPWDHNEALSKSPGVTAAAPSQGGLSLTMNEVSSNWPLIRYLADDSVYYAMYKAHLRNFNNTVFTQAAMDAMFTKYHTMITPYVIGANGEQPDATYLPDPSAFAAGLQELKNHVARRRALISGFVP